MSGQGLFIVIDGPSGSGKDSVIKGLLKNLHKLIIKTVFIQETRGKNYNRKKILLATKTGDKKTAETIINERKKLYLKKVAPELAKNTLVIANRGEPSTLVYQTLKQEVTVKDVWNMHRDENILIPDLVVILNCNVKEALKREKLKGQSLQKKDKKFMSGKFSPDRKKVHANYGGIKDFLEKKGVSVLYLKNDNISVNKQSKIIVGKIKEKLNIL